jgi:hypothetical protein
MLGGRANIGLRPLTSHQTRSRAIGKGLHAPRATAAMPRRVFLVRQSARFWTREV